MGVTALLVHVDDVKVTWDDMEEIEKLEICSTKGFESKELGKLKYLFGIEVTHSWQEIFISQQKYVIYLLLIQANWEII